MTRQRVVWAFLLLFALRSCTAVRINDLIGGQAGKVAAARDRDAGSLSAMSVSEASRNPRLQDDDDYDDEDEEISDKEMVLAMSRVGQDPNDDVDDSFCHKRKYRKRTLKVVKEMPFVGLFPDLQRTRRFEGSGIAYGKGYYWVVFDSLRSLGRVDLRFSFRGPENRLVGAVGDESQFEGIAYLDSSDTFFVLRETMEHEEHGLVPLVEELQLTEEGASYQVKENCIVRFAMQDENKGFESLVVFERDGQRHVLGLCESNFCKTVQGHDPPGLQRGNGRLVWATYHAPEDKYDECGWEVKKVIELPEECYLLDYSAIAFRGGPFGTDVAVVSQEDSAVWVGSFDWEAMEFVNATDSKMYYFPRGDTCFTRYCNVEGVAWIDAERLVFTSDKAKKTQNYRCMEMDQSVHIMGLP